MAYKQEIYRFNNCNEYEFKFKGNYGAKGEKRAPKKKPTKEQIERQNQVNRENKARRILLLNFHPKDLWICLKYPAGVRAGVDDIREDVRMTLRLIRQEYKKRNEQFKWYMRLEVGGKGSLHCHMVVNRIWSAQTDLIINECWKKVLDKNRRGSPGRGTDGLVDYRSIYEEGGYKKLASYICKKPQEGTEEYEQLSMFEPEEQKKLLYVSHSRNLEIPVPEVKTRSHWTMRRLIENGPRPTPGYYIDKDSVYIGVNPFNGFTYLKYTEYKLDRGGGSS